MGGNDFNDDDNFNVAIHCPLEDCMTFNNDDDAVVVVMGTIIYDAVTTTEEEEEDGAGSLSSSFG